MQPIWDRAVVINLPSRKDRFKRVRRRLAEAGLHAEIVPGVNTLAGDVVPNEWPGVAGAYGCMLAHVREYERALADGVQSLLMLEDDVVFTQDFGLRLSECVADLPADWQMFYFGVNHMRPSIPVTDRIHRVVCGYTTHAFVIREAAIGIALDDNLLKIGAIDMTLAEVQKRLPCYSASPALATQEVGFSDICGTIKDYSACIR